MHMQVGNALADAVIHGYKRTLGAQSGFQGAAQNLHICQKLAVSVSWEFRERFDVISGYEQDVAGEQRTVIEERERSVVLEHHRREHAALRYLAENTRHNALSRCPSGYRRPRIG